MELKIYLKYMGISIFIFALLFSIYVNMTITQKQVSFTKDYEKFKEEWIKGSYNLEIIKEKPQISENYYDSCNEREINEMLKSLNQTINNLIEEIDMLDYKVYRIKKGTEKEREPVNALTFNSIV